MKNQKGLANLQTDGCIIMNRIAIVGTSGCGKTTLGQRLSNELGVPLIDLDDLYWLPGWEIRPEGEFRDLVKNQVAKSKWIISGNYSIVRSLIWPNADTIIWINASRSTCLWQALKRSVSRITKRQPTCNGNYETWGRLFSRKSILLWIWHTHRHRKRDYGEQVGQDERWIQIDKAMVKKPNVRLQ